MKIVCQKALLVDAVSNVSRAVSGKSPIPALEGILIKASEGEITLVGYDLEIGIITKAEADVRESGQIVIPARLLLDIIRKIPSETISISCDDKQMCMIKGGVSEFTILGIPASDYPELPAVDESSNLVLKQGVLKSMIDQTLFAIATTDSKPVHTGSLFDIKKENITLVSVDGYRLALRKEPFIADQDYSFIVPGKTLGEVSKLLKEEENEVCMVVSSKHIVFKIDGYQVISRLLEGDFLDYNAAIPKTEKTSIEVSTRLLIEGIERTSLLISDRLKSPLKLNMSDEKIRISCNTTMGKAYDEVDCKIDGDGINMGFNNKYLLDALKASDCDMVKLLVNGPVSPMRVVPLEGESFLFLVLPVRVKNDE
ncbi:MAG: DNA polymerase III subunit beta [Oscillospiraceae bacterium]|nr:DNA polymerase III subunit beta [Oscillospiraceae bacterium]